jgi:hypothetical protein
MSGRTRHNHLSFRNHANRSVAYWAPVMAVIALLVLLTVFASSARGVTGDEYIVSVFSINEVPLLAQEDFPGSVATNVSTGGTFRVDLQMLPPAAFVVTDIREVATGLGVPNVVGFLSGDMTSQSVYSYDGLKPFTNYEMTVEVHTLAGVLESKTYRFTTGAQGLPAIDASSPFSGQTDVATNITGVFLEFNTPMNPNSFTQNKFVMTNLTQGVQVPTANQLYEQDRWGFMTTPALITNNLYRVDIEAGMSSKAGQTIADPESIIFSTGNGGLPSDIWGVYPQRGSTVDASSLVGVLMKPALFAGPTRPQMWQNLGLPQAAFESTGDYDTEAVNPQLMIAVPRKTSAFNKTTADDITTWGNVPAYGNFSGYAWNWTATRPAQYFTDVPTTDPYYPFISTIQSQGYINGFPNPDGTTFRFGGQQTLARAQGAKIFVNALHIPVDLDNTTTKFSDVYSDANGYPAAYVNAGVAAGIIQGKTATTFAPTDPLLYRHVVLFVDRLLRTRLSPDVYLNPPAGFTIDWGFPEADRAAYNGLLVGVGTRTAEHPLGDPRSVDPYAAITRDDAAAVAAMVEYWRQLYVLPY